MYAANVGTPQRQNVYNGTVQNGASGGMISNGQQIASPSFNQTVAQQQIASPSVGQTATPQQSSKPQTPLNENGSRTEDASERVGDVIDGIKITDGKVGGKIPIEEFKKIRISSIKNPTGKQIVNLTATS